VQGAQTLGLVVAAPQRLAIDRQHRLLHAAGRGRLGTQRLQPVHEASLKRGRLQTHEHASKNVLARHPMRQIEHANEKLRFERRPAGNGCRPAGASEHRHQSDDQDAFQRVLPIDRGAWIFQPLEIAYDLI